MPVGTGYCEVGKIEYSRRDDRPGLANTTPGGVCPPDDCEKDGCLIYIKPAFYGSEPVSVYNYAQTDAAFPHQTTADQFFDEAQWEAYRKLGEHIGNHLFQAGGHASLASALGIA